MRVVPMQPELASEPFHRPGWVYEEKLDGWRLVAYKDGPRGRPVSRTGVDHTARFREIAAAVAGLLAPSSSASSICSDGRRRQGNGPDPACLHGL
jgi:ATP-dependent DNA ligase